MRLKTSTSAESRMGVTENGLGTSRDSRQAGGTLGDRPGEGDSRIIRGGSGPEPRPLTSRMAACFVQGPGCLKYSSLRLPGFSLDIGWDQKGG